MSIMKKVLLGVFSFLILALVNASQVKASEGIFELANRVGEDGRCFAVSILMDDLQHRVLISCRDIIYPGGTDIFHYVVWATPLEGGDPKRLGEIGLGKEEFKMRDTFGSMFVTRERTNNPRSPEGTVVMQGNVQRISFLESRGTQAGTPQPTNELGEQKLHRPRHRRLKHLSFELSLQVELLPLSLFLA